MKSKSWSIFWADSKYAWEVYWRSLDLSCALYTFHSLLFQGSNIQKTGCPKKSVTVFVNLGPIKMWSRSGSHLDRARIDRNCCGPPCTVSLGLLEWKLLIHRNFFHTISLVLTHHSTFLCLLSTVSNLPPAGPGSIGLTLTFQTQQKESIYTKIKQSSLEKD